MRVQLMLGTMALTVAFAFPAWAQMCGGAQTKAGESSMCGGAEAAAMPPASGGQTAEAKKSGCACCKNMAMMEGPKDESMPEMDMPQMETPKVIP